MAGEAVTAMIVAADAGDNPLADRREDREAAAARERKAKVAKLNSQTANAMEVVRAQQAAKERGAFDGSLGESAAQPPLRQGLAAPQGSRSRAAPWPAAAAHGGQRAPATECGWS